MRVKGGLGNQQFSLVGLCVCVSLQQCDLLEQALIAGFAILIVVFFSSLKAQRQEYLGIMLERGEVVKEGENDCLLYTSPSPRD